jgi:hypothetical protein
VTSQDSGIPKSPFAHSKAEAAVLLRVTESWLERRAAARAIPFTMVGGAYHFTDEHLAEIIRMHEYRPPVGTAVAPAPDQPAPRRSRRQGAPMPGGEVTILRPKPRPDGPRRRKGPKDTAA